MHVGQHVKNGGAAFGALVVHLDGAGKDIQRHTGAEMLAGAADDQHARVAAFVQLREHCVQFAPERGCMVFIASGLFSTKWATWLLVESVKQVGDSVVVVMGQTV